MTPEEIKAMDDYYGKAEEESVANSPDRGDAVAMAKAKYGGGVRGWLYDNIIAPAGQQLASDVNRAKSAAFGAVDGLTLSALSNFDGYQEMRDEAKSSNPWAYMGGNVGGSIAGAGKLVKGAQAAKNIAGAAKPALEAAEQWLGKNMATRAAGGAAAGASAAGVQAFNEGEPVLPAMAVGGVAGAAFTPTAEMVGGLVNRATGVKAGQDVIDKANSILERSPKLQGATADDLIQIRKRLGDEATLADIDPTMRDFAKMVMRDPRNYDDSLPLYQLMGKRLDNLKDPTATIQGKFRSDMQTAMQPFINYDMQLTRPRTMDQITEEVTATQKSLQPLYTSVLRSYDNWAAKPDQIKEMADLAMRDGDLNNPLGANGEKVLSFINERVDALAKSSGKNGLRPVELQQLRLDLGPEIANYLKKDRNTARQTIAVKQFLEDDYLTKLPGYSDLNSRYTTASGFARGTELGQGFFSKMKADDYDNLSLELSALSPADRQGFYEGVARDLYTVLGNTSSNKKLIKKLTEDESLKRGLRVAFTDDVAEQFTNEAVKALTLQGTAAKLAGGADVSRHSVNAAAAELKHKNNVTLIIGGVLGSILSKIPVSQNMAAGGAKRIAEEVGLGRKQTQFANDLLQKQGPALDPFLEDIAAKKLNPANNPMAGTLIDQLQQKAPTTGAVGAGLGTATSQQGNVMPSAISERENERMMGR